MLNTLLLTRSAIEPLIEPVALAATMRSAFSGYSAARPIPGRRFFSPLPGPGDVMILAPGLVADIPAYTVKVHAKFPQQQPAINGLLLLHDLDTGALLAVMDSTYITAARTGLGAALATDILARPDADTVAVVGAGVQGLFQLRYLALLRTVKQVTVYDTSAAQARRYAERMTAELGLPVTPCETLAAAVGEADIILTATWASRPILFADQVRDGCHITTLGADQPGEAEIDAGLIRRARFICDDRELALAQGAIGGVGLGADAIAAELGEVINGTRPGRTDPDQITIYGAVGLAFQDLVTAWQVFCHARSRPLPQTIDFLA